MTRPRSIPPEDLALAYELRQCTGAPWKVIAPLLGYGHQELCDAVNHVVVHGFRAG